MRNKHLIQNTLLIIAASFLLFPAITQASPTINVEKLAAKNKDKFLTPEDVKAGIPALAESQFPLSWKQVSYGQVKGNTNYRYLFIKQENDKTYYQPEFDGEIIGHTKYFIEKGLEYTYTDAGANIDAGMRNGCIFVLGDCEYPYIKSTKILTTTFENGIWTSTYSNGTGKGVLTSIYNKNGLIIYRHSLVKNSIQHFESETFLQE